MKKYKKIIYPILIGSIILLPGFKGKAIINECDKTKTTTKKDYLYSRSSSNSRVIGNININEDIFSLLSVDNFDLINNNNVLAFIDSNSLNLDYDINDLTYQKIEQIGVTSDNVNLRVGPDTTYERIDTISNGTLIDIILESSNGWYLVDYDGKLGFINNSYAHVIDFDKVEREFNKLPSISKICVATTDVNVRSESNTNSQVLGVLREGKSIDLSEILDNGWIRVTKDNQFGYVKSDYVKIRYKINGDYYKHVYMNKDANGYDYPYGSVIGSIPKYETAFVYGSVDEFYFVESEGRVGFIKKCDCNTLTGTYVVVDISSQKMYLYNDLDLILESDVVTGKTETPTDIGDFKIRSMEKNRTLIGPDYEAFVKYWMGYNGGEGLHDASWKSHFGGNIYITRGSHGCVNLPEKVAKELYDNVSVGDKVLVKK